LTTTTAKQNTRDLLARGVHGERHASTSDTVCCDRRRRRELPRAFANDRETVSRVLIHRSPHASDVVATSTSRRAQLTSFTWAIPRSLLTSVVKQRKTVFSPLIAMAENASATERAKNRTTCEDYKQPRRRRVELAAAQPRRKSGLRSSVETSD
jgi:hypothetical protein